MTSHTNTFRETESLLAAILSNLDDISKPVKKFISHLYSLWWSNSGRFNFVNLSRYSYYCEQALRNGFERGFRFLQFQLELIRLLKVKEMILVFDPSYISKSGKKTYGINRFWSGKDQCAKRGLEIGCLAMVDVKRATAFHLEAVQTPAAEDRKKEGISMVEHYARFIIQRINTLLKWSQYIVVDGYFMKKEFIQRMEKNGLHVITKMRQDANLRYLYNGVQREGRGRKRMQDGKVNLKKIDKRRLKLFYRKDDIECYTAILYSITLKQKVCIIYVYDCESNGYEVLLSTDVGLAPKKIIKYYRLRFQIEFLIRDAKQHAGLEHCQARGEKKLNFHFNMALSSASVAKAAYFLMEPGQCCESFSFQNIRRLYQNKFLADFIFSNLELELNSKKIKRLYEECLDVGLMAA